MSLTTGMACALPSFSILPEMSSLIGRSISHPTSVSKADTSKPIMIARQDAGVSVKM